MTADVIDALVPWVEAVGALMIVAGLVITLFRVIRVPFLPQRPPLAVLQIRLGLGMFLALGLEFLLAADILRTAVAPTWEEIGQLAAIAAIRTGLNYFLGREFIQGEHEIASLEAARLDARAAGPPSIPNVVEGHVSPAAPTNDVPPEGEPEPTPPRPSASKPGYWSRLTAALKGPAWVVPAVDQSPTEPPGAP